MRFAWGLALALAGCGASEPFLSSEGLASLLLVRLFDGNAEVEAFDLAASPPIVRDPPAAGELYALGYAATLNQLGLQAGALTVTPEGGPLPPAEREHRFDGSAWDALAGRPPALAAVRVTARDGCATFELFPRTIPLDDGRPSLLVALDDARALSATELGAFSVHELTRSYPLVELATSTPNLAAYRRGDELWLAGLGGRLVHGNLERGFEEAPRVPLDTTRRVAIDGAHGDAPFELFVTDGLQGVARFDGTEWRVLKAPMGEPPEGTNAGIAWMEPGLALLVGTSIDGGVEVRADGRTRAVRFDVPLAINHDSVYAARHVEGRGAVVGTRNDVMFARRGDAWEMLPRAPVTPAADAIIGLGRGAFMAGGNGIFAEWRGNDELCEVIDVASGNGDLLGAPLGAGFVLISEAFETRSAIIGKRRY